MSILDRSALEQSPLADLHAIASELSLDGYRRLRKADLINAIIARQSGENGAAAADAEEDAAGGRRRRGRRGGRARAASAAADEPAAPEAATERPARRRRGAARGAGEIEGDAISAVSDGADVSDLEAEPAGEPVAEGVVEVLPNGSAFLRVSPPEPSDDDIYISAAQVKRCELVSGDRISGPRRAPRRSERFASLVRVDTINDRPASEVADSARFDDLPAGFPIERFKLGSDDPTLKALEFLTPFGRGSRVTVSGSAQAGKTEALRRLAGALSGLEDVTVLVALAGVRPEELPDWEPLTPAAALSSSASADAQTQAIERVLDQAKRLVSRGNHVVVLIDSLAAVSAGAARRALACARRVVDGGSLTVIAAAPEALGGETTVIALDAALTAARRFPAVDLAASWTMRPELLVGDGGAELIVRTRAEALDAR